MKKSLVISVLTFLFVFIGFTLLLLLPRNPEYTYHVSNTNVVTVEADYPFSYALIKDNIMFFIEHILAEGGLGKNIHGVPIIEEVPTLFGRSLKIIVPAFLVSFIIGGLIGIFQYYFRNSLLGKIQSFFSWLFSSIPDFFLYISFQYLLIELFDAGFPKFTLFGHEEPYSFVIPLIALAIFPIIHVSKSVYSGLENEANQEYIQTARSKGLETPRLYIHMLWNCWPSILSQVQVVLLYIFTSLPIIEYLSGYIGAGYQLLISIQSGQETRALGLMLPYLLTMLFAVILARFLRHRLVPEGGV